MGNQSSGIMACLLLSSSAALAQQPPQTEPPPTRIVVTAPYPCDKKLKDGEIPRAITECILLEEDFCDDPNPAPGVPEQACGLALWERADSKGFLKGRYIIAQISRVVEGSYPENGPATPSEIYILESGREVLFSPEALYSPILKTAAGDCRGFVLRRVWGQPRVSNMRIRIDGHTLVKDDLITSRDVENPVVVKAGFLSPDCVKKR